MITQCVVCNSNIIINEKHERLLNATKYWSYEEDGKKRPYCDAMCALLDYQNKEDAK